MHEIQDIMLRWDTGELVWILQEI